LRYDTAGYEYAKKGGKMKRIAFAFAVLALLVPAAALAYPVQEFSIEARDIKPDGRFTVVYSSRTYDSSGGVPPALRENYLRLPIGAVIRKEFLKKKYYCDATRLLKDLQAAPEQSVRFARRVDKLASTIKRIRSRLRQKALRNAKTCARSRIGEGTAQVDARPVYDELIPVVFYMFLGKGTQPGAVASLQIIGMPDENSAEVKELPITVQQTRVPFALNLFNEPTEGKYGYKIVLPTGPIAGVNISIAEVRAVVPGITLKKNKVTCIKRNRGRCARKKVRKANVFWITTPTCPSGKLSFLGFYGYDDPVPDITKTVEASCPTFRK
jgi:hypothetical protein